MRTLQNALDALIAKIKDTDIYNEYRMQKRVIGQYPALLAKVEEFRRRNIEIQNYHDQSAMYDAMERFEAEYERFREDPIVNDFLEAELAYCRMMQDIQLTMTQELEFE